MNIRFAHPEISEFAIGELHFKNDGGTISISETVGRALLAAPHFIDGKKVCVFERADDTAAAEGTAGESPEETPEDAAMKLMKHNSREELENIAARNGIDTEGLNTKGSLATAIATKLAQGTE